MMQRADGGSGRSLAVFILLVPLLVVWGSGALGRGPRRVKPDAKRAESAAEEEQGEQARRTRSKRRARSRFGG